MDKYQAYINKEIDGRYKVESVVGVGGMAVVLKAYDSVMNRTVAIKMLNDEYSKDEKAVKRFVNESKAVAMLSHPNVVTIFDVAMSGELKYIVMEFIDGITLKDYMDKKGTLVWREALHYTVQILDGIAHAHAKGIVHRDIKPQNIMLLKDGTIKVTDFGIAKIPNSESITVTDKAIGTVNYISPEQASGNKVDACSDMYSVGVMLYEMVTGKLPFVAESPVAVAMMQVSDFPTSPSEINPGIPKGLEQIILKAMNKDPKTRFSSCEVMRKALNLVKENPMTVFTEKNNGPTVSNGAKGKKKGKKVFGKPTLLPVISGVTLAFFIVAVVCAGVLVYRFFNQETIESGTDIIVPDLLGDIYTPEYERELLENKFRVIDVKYVSSADHEAGEIIDQYPEANAQRRLTYNAKFYDIRLTVNQGLADVILDDYSLMDAREVKIELERLGLVCVEIEQADEVVLQNYVISTTPAAGEVVSPGSIIKVFVSKGREIKTVLVPELVGYPRADAEKAIIEAKLSVGKITYMPSDKKAGIVIDSSHDVGDRVPQKITKIDLTVSDGSLYVPEVIVQTPVEEPQPEQPQEPENTPSQETQGSTPSDEDPAEQEETEGGQTQTDITQDSENTQEESVEV